MQIRTTPIPRGISAISSVLALIAVASCGSSTKTSTSPTSLTRCGVTLSGNATVPAQGGNGTVNVAAERECTWSASIEGQWLTLRSGSTGQGNGAVEFTAARNPDPVTRRGAVILNDTRVELTQGAADCVITLADTAMSFGQSGGSGRAEVRASSELCTWRAESDANWIVLRSDANGKGSTPLLFEVMPSAGVSRRGAIRIAGQQFDITQSQGCAYAITPSSFAAAPAGGSGSVAIATGAGCAWTAASSVSWLTVSPAAGEGPAAVAFTVAPSGGTERSGTALIAGQTFTVTQGQGCTFDVNPLTHSVAAAGGSVSVNVATGQGCPWNIASSAAWITLNGQASRTGSGTVELVVASTNAGARSGTVSVAGQTFTVTQGQGCTFDVNPLTHSVAAAGGSVSVNVATGQGCPWNIASSAAWITLNGQASRTGSGTVELVVASTNAGARSGTVSIAGRTVTINQLPGCSFTIAPQSAGVSFAGGAGKVTVNGSPGCAWTAVSNAEWIQIASGASGNGNGEVTYTVLPSVGAARSGTLTIAGQTFTVQQTAAPACSFKVSPLTIEVDDDRQNREVDVETSPLCTWSATSNVSWIRINGEATRIGSDDVRFQIDRNETNNGRTGTLTIAGQTVTITQRD
jgi:Putative binding domain, N-terminal/Viral BACON domain